MRRRPAGQHPRRAAVGRVILAIAVERVTAVSHLMAELHHRAAGGPTIQEIGPANTRLAFAAMRELRPRLASEEVFVRLVEETLRPQGYRLLGAFENARIEAAAIAGFHLGRSIAWGHYLYVDDLSTLPEARRRGHARALLDWLLAEGRRLGCEQLHLDSGVGAERIDAHRLYLNAGLHISSHHFARGLAEA